MKSLVFVYAVVGLVSTVFAKPPMKKPTKGGNAIYGSYQYGSYEVHSGQIYHGKYGGKCGNDGLYYNNEYSFIICSNGNAYEQHCAPGSRNSGYSNYEYGKDYYYHDFCDVNLVDSGYAGQGGYAGDGYAGGYETEYHHEHHAHEEKREGDYKAKGGYSVRGKHESGYSVHGKREGGYALSGKPEKGYPMQGKQKKGYPAQGKREMGYGMGRKGYTEDRYGYERGYKPGYD